MSDPAVERAFPQLMVDGWKKTSEATSERMVKAVGGIQGCHLTCRQLRNGALDPNSRGSWQNAEKRK
jgi:hypothetical protein